MTQKVTFNESPSFSYLSSKLPSSFGAAKRGNIYHRLERTKSSSSGLISSFASFLIKHRKDISHHGIWLAINGDYKQAIYYLSLAIAVGDHDYNNYYQRACCYLEIDDAEKAMKDAAECIKKENNESRGFLKLGEALSMINMYIQAELTYEKSLRLNPNCNETKERLIGNTYDALIAEGFDEIKAGYASKKCSSIKDAIAHLKNGEFEVNLMIKRERKRLLYKRWTSKKGKLVPVNFY